MAHGFHWLLVKMLQDNLHETIKDTYSVAKVCETRRQIYQDLVDKKENKNQLELVK